MKKSFDHNSYKAKENCSLISLNYQSKFFWKLWLIYLIHSLGSFKVYKTSIEISENILMCSLVWQQDLRKSEYVFKIGFPVRKQQPRMICTKSICERSLGSNYGSDYLYLAKICQDSSKCFDFDLMKATKNVEKL